MSRWFRFTVFIFLLTLNFIQLHSAVKEGDTLKFWSVTYVDWIKGQLPVQRHITAVCKKVGVRCYFFYDIEDTNKVSQSNIDFFVNKFDSSYYKLTDLYGSCPDALDNDPRVFLLAIKPDWWGGYFDPAQQMPDTMVNRLWGVHSSEHEIIYFSANLAKPDRVSVLAHEFGHMLGWGQDHSPEPPDNPTYYWEDVWIDEGYSTFADSYLNGNINETGVFNNPFFEKDTRTSLIYFSYNFNYSSSMLFMTYMYEHYGKDTYIKSLLKNQLNGIASIRSTLLQLGYNIPFDDIFENWTIANYADDKDFQKGIYYYNHYDFPKRFIRNEHSAYPDSYTDSLRAYSSDYIELNSNDSLYNLKIVFNCERSSKFRLALLLMKSIDSTIIDVIDVTLNSDNEGEYELLNFGKDFDKVVMVVMNTDSSLKEFQYVDYSYHLTPSVAVVKESKKSKSGFSVNFNKSTESVYIKYPAYSYEKKQIFLYNLYGQLVSTLNTNNTEAGISVSGISRGLYFICTKFGSKCLTKPVLVY
ncbi:MAG: T9SS type A sorting domain-containing protein [Bacteroidota bacterium]